jgi:hypothetical protein
VTGWASGLSGTADTLSDALAAAIAAPEILRTACATLLDAGPHPTPLRQQILSRIAHERAHQEERGYTPAHDDTYRFGELAAAAGCLALDHADDGAPRADWPWPTSVWKRLRHPGDETRTLLVAASLLVAELERRHRAEGAA